MYGVNPQAIKKKKKDEVESITADLDKSTKDISAKMGEMPSLKAKEPEEMEMLKSKGPMENKQPKAEIEIELMLQGAKKRKGQESEESEGANAYEKDLGEFKVPMTKEGKFKESGESRARYLRKLKMMKK